MILDTITMSRTIRYRYGVAETKDLFVCRRVMNDLFDIPEEIDKITLILSDTPDPESYELKLGGSQYHNSIDFVVYIYIHYEGKWNRVDSITSQNNYIRPFLNPTVFLSVEYEELP